MTQDKSLSLGLPICEVGVPDLAELGAGRGAALLAQALRSWGRVTGRWAGQQPC